MRRLFLHTLLLPFFLFSQNNNPELSLGAKLSVQHNSLLYNNNIGVGIGLNYKIPIRHRSLKVSSEFLLRYQNFTSDEEYPVNYGTLELNNEGEPILVGAHNAYNLKTEGHYGLIEKSFKIGFEQTSKLTLNIIPYYNCYLTGRESQETVESITNGSVMINTNPEKIKRESKNRHSIGTYFGISYQINYNLNIDFRTPIFINSTFEGSDISDLYYYEKMGKNFVISLIYFFY